MGNNLAIKEQACGAYQVADRNRQCRVHLIIASTHGAAEEGVSHACLTCQLRGFCFAFVNGLSGDCGKGCLSPKPEMVGTSGSS